MNNILKLIIKNLKMFFRSKISALVLILAPLLIVLLVGMAFDHSNSIGIKVGVYTPENNEYVDDFVASMNERDFRAINYDNTSYCINDMKKGIVHACIDFPPDFDFDLNYQKDVTFYVDYSKVNLVWMIMESVSDVFASRSSKIGEELASVLLTKLSNSKEELKKRVIDVKDITEKNTQIKNQEQEIINILQSSKISYADIPLGETKNTITKVRDDLSSNIDTARNNLNSLKSALAVMGLSFEERNETNNLIESGLDSLDDAKRSLISTNSNYSMVKLGSMINQIYNEMNSLIEQVESTNNKFIQSKEKASYNKEELDKNLDKLKTINQSISSIIDEISSIQITDAAAISNPVKVDIKHISSKKTYLNYLFPSMLVLVAMFISLLLGTTMVMSEKHGPAFFRLSISPVKKFSTLLSIFLTVVLIVSIQMLVILLLSAYFFSTKIFIVISPILIILSIGVAFFTLLGMIIGYMFKSEATGVLGSISFGSILLLTSGIIIPIESVPKTLKDIIQYNPFIILENMIREVIHYNTYLMEFWKEFSIIGIMAIILFLIMWLQESIIISPKINKLMYQYALHKKKKNKVESKIIRIISYPIRLIIGFLNHFKRRLKRKQKHKKTEKRQKKYKETLKQKENKEMLKERIREEERVLKEKERELIKIMKQKDEKIGKEKKRKIKREERKRQKEETEKRKKEEAEREKRRKEEREKRKDEQNRKREKEREKRKRKEMKEKKKQEKREKKEKEKERRKEEELEKEKRRKEKREKRKKEKLSKKEIKKKTEKNKRKERETKHKRKPAKIEIVKMKHLPKTKPKPNKKEPIKNIKKDSWEDELSKIEDKLKNL